MSSPATVCGEWRLGRNLGSGGFGTVQVWVHLKTGRKLAVKKCKWEESELTPVQKERWSKEVRIMRYLVHPNIVQTEDLPPELATNGNSLPVLCMEYCRGGDLRSVLCRTENCCGLEEDNALTVISHVTSAVEYLHCYNITHRDLKPENIVLQIVNDTALYKLIDLGYAKELGEASTSASIVGTLNYVAPELLWKETYSCSVDYWSLGILFYEIVTGIRPFLPQMQHTMSWMQHIKRKNYDDIHAYESEGTVIFGKDIRGPTHLSKYLQEKLVQWFRIVLQWDPKRRGRIKNEDGTSDLVVFKLLHCILAKRIVYAFCTRTYTLNPYEIDKHTSVQGLQKLISNDIQTPIDQQTLTDYYGAVIPTSDTPILSQIRHPVLFVFKNGSTLPENFPAPNMPANVWKMIEQSKMYIDPGTLKDYYRATIFFMKQEKNLFELYIFALSIKVDLVNKKIKMFSENMNTALLHTDALVKQLHTVQTQLATRPGDEKRREAFELTHKKVHTLSSAAEQIKIKLRSLTEAYNELKSTADRSDFGSDLSERYNSNASIYDSYNKEKSHKSAQPISMVKQVFKFLASREALLHVNNNIANIARKADGLEEELMKLEGSFESVVAMTTIYASELREIAQSDADMMQEQCPMSQEPSSTLVEELMDIDDCDNVIYNNILIRHTLDNLVTEMQRKCMKMLNLDTK